MKESDPKGVIIVQYNDPNNDQVLRKEAQLVPIEDITTAKIQKIIADMKAVLATQKDGIAIAAPQIGFSLQIFVVSGKVLKAADPKYKGDETDLVFINPTITKTSRTKKEVEEGCLSVRWKYGKLKRAQKVSITAHDENGQAIERGASGLLAQVFQHEIDHLHGILFIDTAHDIEDMPPENLE